MTLHCKTPQNIALNNPHNDEDPISSHRLVLPGDDKQRNFITTSHSPSRPNMGGYFFAEFL
jgi:hypothetical protein